MKIRHMAIMTHSKAVEFGLLSLRDFLQISKTTYYTAHNRLDLVIGISFMLIKTF